MRRAFGEEPPEEDLDLGAEPEHGAFEEMKTRFERWHHPRKQFVRVRQWCAAVRQLIGELNLGPGEPFSYLTLPGNELLDVRALQGVCARERVPLRYLGFNSVGKGTAQQAELNLAHNQVRELDGIHPFSAIVEERLETVANDLSPASRRTREFGPFHAINIDLCDSIAVRDVDDRRGSTLGVVAKLLELQLQTSAPWLLFVTTMAQPGLISPRAHDGFKGAIAANTAASDDFKAELAQLISTTTDQLDASLDAAWQGQDPDFLRLFCTGLGKWLLSLLGQAAPPRNFSLVSSYYYRVGPGGPDMLSIAFRCDTPAQALRDPHGILVAQPQAAPFSEVQLAIAMAQGLRNSADLDCMLRDDPQLAEQLIAQAGRLMSSARFSVPAYEAWAREELGRFRAAG
jgi:hypothetical protein